MRIAVKETEMCRVQSTIRTHVGPIQPCMYTVVTSLSQQTCVASNFCTHGYISKKKVRFYIAQYPVHRTAQSAFTHYFLGRPVQSNTISTSQGSIQPHATINGRKVARTHIHHCLLPGTHLYS